MFTVTSRVPGKLSKNEFLRALGEDGLVRDTNPSTHRLVVMSEKRMRQKNLQGDGNFSNLRSFQNGTIESKESSAVPAGTQARDLFAALQALEALGYDSVVPAGAIAWVGGSVCSQHSPVVHRQGPAQVLPDLIAGLHDIFRQRAFFSRREILIQLRHARRPEDHHV